MYVDSGCSNRMTGDRDCSVSLGEKVTSQVKLGDSKLQSVQGKGITFEPKNNGKSKLIPYVMCVPGLTQNLFKCWLAY